MLSSKFTQQVEDTCKRAPGKEQPRNWHSLLKELKHGKRQEHEKR